jgi:hypothetical protein
MRGKENSERGRGWGPFSGRQLTTIIVTVVVMAMLPVGAYAVASGTNSFITDPSSNAHARVNGSGQLNVSAAGAKTFFQKNTFGVLATPTAIATPPAGRALVITSIAIDTWDAAVTGTSEYLALQMSTTNSTCSLLSLSPDWTYGLNPGGVGSTVVPFNPGVVVPAGRSLCATNNDDVNLGFDVYVYGYLISADSAPTGLAVSGPVKMHVQHH